MITFCNEGLYSIIARSVSCICGVIIKNFIKWCSRNDDREVENVMRTYSVKNPFISRGSRSLSESSIREMMW